jgi:glycosyltransferase involved in cell wall biosynthesis
MHNLLPISALVPTRNRSHAFNQMLTSLAQQSAQPIEMIVVDGSTTEETQQICQRSIAGLATQIIYHKAIELGAATQRNQAFAHATQPYILFLDDDIWFEPDCLMRLWQAIQSDPELGGVNAMITNQKYLPPGRVSRLLFQLLHGHKEKSYAGKCIGPALNLLPEDRPDLTEVVPVEWLNTTCVLYRQKALPNPPFPSNFTGYSLMEDVTLSLMVGKQWKLANARTARIFHDSQPGDHKKSFTVLAEMELINRHYVMTQILNRRQLRDYLKLTLLQLFGVATLLTSVRGWRSLPSVIAGKLKAIAHILSSGKELAKPE